MIGGSEIEAQRVSAALIRRGHRILVVCAGGPPMPPLRHWTDPEGVPVRLFGHRFWGVWRDRAYALGVLWTLWRERRRYRVVYFLMQGLHLAFGLPFARLLGKPVVMKIGGSGVIPMMNRSWLGRWELAALRRWARRVMILNDGMHREAIEAGFSEKSLLWMPNPVDTAVFAPASEQEQRELRETLQLPLNRLIVIYCGRLAPEKGLITLLDGFAEVARRMPQAMLVLVGDGSLREELTKRGAHLGIASRVHFAGLVEPRRISSWLRASDIFALVSPSEGFPCSLVEAMSCGLASVASDIPAITQLIDSGIHGITVPPGDSPATAAAMLALLEDPDSRRRMGQAARARVIEHYSIERIAGLYESLLEEAVSEPSRYTKRR